MNESVAYTTAVQAMYKGSDGEAKIPSYVVFDSRYRREYPFGPFLPSGMKLDWMVRSREFKQYLKCSDTLEGLAQKLSVDPVGLRRTVTRFNQFSATGIDSDFHRGENSYDRLYGDARISPNPCLAPIEEGPFYGVEIFPGDIGTKGGLLTNQHAQVLAQDGSVIAGLCAIGNSSASPMGRYYPGAGATLGPAMTFGFIAANHACGGTS